MASSSAKQKSIAEWDALLARYPLGSPWEIARQLLVVGAANAVVVRLLFTGQIQPFHLVLLVGIEAVILTAIAWIQSRLVPRSALMEKPQPLRTRLGTLAFGAVWLGFVYAVVIGAFLGSGRQLIDAIRDPLATLRQNGLLWPLAITLTFALVDATRDWMHWRDVGGFFLSTPGFNSMARWLTLFLGGIPFFVPLAAGVWAISEVAKRLGKGTDARAKSPGISGLAPLIAPVAIFGLFGLMGWFVKAGVSGWAIGYCSAKLLSECFLVCLPLIATKARAEEAAAVAGKGTATSS